MSIGDVLDEETERIAKEIVDAAFQVHNALGPGFLESIYVSCLILELQSRNFFVEREVHVPVIYRGQTIPPGLRLDLLVEKIIIIEAKAVDTLHPIFFTKTKSYMKLSNIRLAFLINFNVTMIKNGIHRIIL